MLDLRWLVMLCVTLCVSLSLVGSTAGLARAQDEDEEGAADLGDDAEKPAAGGEEWEAPPPDESDVVDADAAAKAQAEAEAEASADPVVSLGLLLGYGIGLQSDVNPWGLGVGVNGGVTLDMGLYIGGEFAYFFGGSNETTVGGTGQEMATLKKTASVWNIGVEPGYVVEAGPLLIRPSLELGIASLAIETVTLDERNDALGGAALYFAPGALAMYAPEKETWFVGLDLDFQLITATPSRQALVLMANAGLEL